MRVQSQRKGYFSKQLRWSHPFMLKKNTDQNLYLMILKSTQTLQ